MSVNVILLDLNGIEYYYIKYLINHLWFIEIHSTSHCQVKLHHNFFGQFVILSVSLAWLHSRSIRHWETDFLRGNKAVFSSVQHMALFLQAALWIMNHVWNIESQKKNCFPLQYFVSMNKEKVLVSSYSKKYISPLMPQQDYEKHQLKNVEIFKMLQK